MHLYALTAFIDEYKVYPNTNAKIFIGAEINIPLRKLLNIIPVKYNNQIIQYVTTKIPDTIYTIIVTLNLINSLSQKLLIANNAPENTQKTISKKCIAY